MNRQLSIWSIALLLLAPGLAPAAVPATLSFSARIADGGRPVVGSHSLTFTFWDVAAGGTTGTNDLWTETQTLDVRDGVVAAALGADTTTPNPLPISAFDGAPLYLEVSMDGTAFGPRMALHSVPYAFRAGIADAVAGSAVTPSNLSGTAGSPGQVPVADGAGAFGWMTPAAAAHAHAGSDVTSAVASADRAAIAESLQCSGCVDDADVAFGISGSKISGAVATASNATYAANLGPVGSSWSQSTFQSAGTINMAGNPVDWTKLGGVPTSVAGGGPRIAVRSVTSGTMAVTTACGSYTYVQLAVPSAGTVLVEGRTATSAIDHVAGAGGNDIDEAYIGDSQTDCSDTAGRGLHAVWSTSPTGRYSATLSAQRAFTVTLPGTYRYYLNFQAAFAGASSTHSVTQGRLIATFFPD